jgi:hypothetical protein
MEQVENLIEDELITRANNETMRPSTENELSKSGKKT